MGNENSVANVFSTLSAAVSKIQSGASKPHSVVYEKTGFGHITVRLEDRMSVKTTQSRSDGPNKK